MLKTVKCSECGASFFAKHSRQKTCSDACRSVRAARKAAVRSRNYRRRNDSGIGNPERRKRHAVPVETSTILRRASGVTYYAPATPEEIKRLRAHGQRIEPLARKAIIWRLTSRGLLMRPDEDDDDDDGGVISPPDNDSPLRVSPVPLGLSKAEVTLGRNVHRIPTTSSVEREVLARLEEAHGDSPPYIEERDWPVRWREALFRAVAIYRKAVEVLNLAHLHGVGHEEIREIHNARRVLADPDTALRLPKRLLENLDRQPPRHVLAARRALIAALREDEVTTQQQEILEATLEQRLRAELAATEARDVLSQIKQIRSDLERQEVERFIAFALAGS